MSSLAPARGASELIATFAVTPHAGAGYDAARRTAEARLAAARAVLTSPRDIAQAARRALAAYGPALRGAFAAATSLAAVAAMREDAAVIGAVLAAREGDRCDDAAMVDAIAAGREVAARVRGAVAFDAAWDVEAIADRMGAAVALARLRRLTPEQSRHALGLAATQAAGLGVAEAAEAGWLGRGKAAFDAVEGAALARAGFTAAAASLEGRRGLFALTAHGCDDAALLGALGERWISA